MAPSTELKLEKYMLRKRMGYITSIFEILSQVVLMGCVRETQLCNATIILITTTSNIDKYKKIMRSTSLSQVRAANVALCNQMRKFQGAVDVFVNPENCFVESHRVFDRCHMARNVLDSAMDKHPMYRCK